MPSWPVPRFGHRSWHVWWVAAVPASKGREATTPARLRVAQHTSATSPMGLGSSCVRDCERPAHEYAEDCMPGMAGMPGPGAGNTHVNGRPTSSGVKVGARPSGGPAAVPPVPNWFRVLDQSGSLQKESARFEEVSPRDLTARDPRNPCASPQESPRPPDERRDGPHTARGAAVCKEGDEISYEGAYMGSMKHGAGRLCMNGCIYEGDFLHDQKHGIGTLTWDDGRQYCGQFDSGKFHGSAVMTWPDGRNYTGQYIEDRKHGEGTFSWKDGRRYQGQWVVGKRHGIGLYTNAKGLTRTGMWQMDRPLHWDVAQRAESARPPGDHDAEPAPTMPTRTSQHLARPSKEAPRGPQPLSVVASSGDVDKRGSPMWSV